MSYAGTRSCSGSTGASWQRRDGVKPESLQPANSRSGWGSCCATKSIIQSSVVVASCGRKAVLPVRGCQTWVIVLRSCDCETDQATRLPEGEGVRINHHGPQATKRWFLSSPGLMTERGLSEPG